MDVAIRDKLLNKLQDEIKSKKNKLKQQKDYLNTHSKSNKFLVGVLNDYKSHQSAIIKQKKAQYDSLQKIMTYLDDIESEIDDSSFALNQMNHQKHEILKEMQKINKEIDELTDSEF